MGANSIGAIGSEDDFFTRMKKKYLDKQDATQSGGGNVGATFLAAELSGTKFACNMQIPMGGIGSILNGTQNYS